MCHLQQQLEAAQQAAKEAAAAAAAANISSTQDESGEISPRTPPPQAPAAGHERRWSNAHVHLDVAELEELGELREENAILKERVASADKRVAAAAATQVREKLLKQNQEPHS
jgi:chemotaxis protein histidine kinase CheA